MIPVIAIGFALLSGLLLWFVAGARGRWWLKAAAVVACSAFTFGVWEALDSFSGWPTEQKPPARSLMLAATVDEPTAIYVWLIPSPDPGLLVYRPDANEPRAFRLPYSREQHAQVDRASEMARSGQLVELRADASTATRRDQRTAAIFRAYRLPSTTLRRKEEVSLP